MGKTGASVPLKPSLSLLSCFPLETPVPDCDTMALVAVLLQQCRCTLPGGVCDQKTSKCYQGDFYVELKKKAYLLCFSFFFLQETVVVFFIIEI